jgi:hypothetical protein
VWEGEGSFLLIEFQTMGEVAHIMYTHVSKCKNDKIRTSNRELSDSVNLENSSSVSEKTPGGCSDINTAHVLGRRVPPDTFAAHFVIIPAC